MSHKLARWLVAVVLCGSLAQARAEVKLPALFSDHMVLEQGVAAPVWGWAAPKEKVTVSIAGQTLATEADAAGKWRVKLAPLAVGGPHVMTVAASNTLTVNDVLIGEVWLGSGQSNMGFKVSGSANYPAEQAAADLPQVRMFTVTSGPAETAQEDCTGAWTVCTPETVGGFSATLYFFGRDLHKTLGVPMGLICSAVGGTPIEAWIDPDVQYASAELKPFLAKAQAANDRLDPKELTAKYEKALAAWREKAAAAKKANQDPPRRPQDPVAAARRSNIGRLYLGKIAPLVGYSIRGAVWYQGESNAQPTKAEFYQYQLPLLVTDWRKKWGEEFPFAWVQLPNFDKGEEWCVIREAMLKTLKLPNTGMAITLDVGDAKNIHPPRKQEVGNRLASWALATVYHRSGFAASGPLPGSHEARGREFVVSFSHADGGLKAAGDGKLVGFELAGEDHSWRPAEARIDGDRVIVSSQEVEHPAAVRYAWSGNPTASLFNGAGLPASPFRTEEW